MPSISDTAYPRLKTNPTERDLEAIYTPTADEISLAQQTTKGKVAHLGFLVLLRAFQRLGYPVLVADVPAAIVQHIVVTSQLSVTRADLAGYDASATRKRHLKIIRDFLNLQPYKLDAQAVAKAAMEFAVMSKHDLVDLVNIAIEELVRQRYELPGFNTLLKLAWSVRHTTNQNVYQKVTDSLSTEDRHQIDALLQVDDEDSITDWNRLKQDPASPNITHFKELNQRLEWLAS